MRSKRTDRRPKWTSYLLLCSWLVGRRHPVDQVGSVHLRRQRPVISSDTTRRVIGMCSVWAFRRWQIGLRGLSVRDRCGLCVLLGNGTNERFWIGQQSVGIVILRRQLGGSPGWKERAPNGPVYLGSSGGLETRYWPAFRIQPDGYPSSHCFRSCTSLLSSNRRAGISSSRGIDQSPSYAYGTVRLLLCV